MTVSEIRNIIGERVRAFEPTAEVLLFGSQARGDARTDSDWDVMVLLDDDTKTERFDVSDKVIRIGWDLDKEINPVVYKKSEWQRKSFTPFYKNVMHDKIEL